MKKRILLVSLALVLAISLVAAGCPPPVVVEPVPDPDGTLTIGVFKELAALDPAAYADRMTEGVIRHMFDGLTTLGPALEPVPQIAKSWRWIDDLTAEYTLRDDVIFHDGSPLTARDVAFSFNRILAAGGVGGVTSPRRGLLGPLERVEVVDEHTIRFHLRRPWPIFFRILSHQQIIREDYYVGLDPDPAARSAKFMKNPVGAGPFKFVSYTPGVELVLERFDDYFGWGGSPPPGTPEKLVFKVIRESATRMAALMAGTIDVALEVPFGTIPLLEGTPGITVVTGKGTRGRWVQMNINRPPFDDVRVRHAMNYAVDIQAILDTLYFGRGAVNAGPLFAFEANVDPALEPFGYDPERARRLLDEAGWPVDPATGYRFSLIVDSVPPHGHWAEAVAAYLRAVDIEASVRMWVMAVIRPKLWAGERSMFVGDWGSSLLDPIGYLDRTLVEYRTGGNYSGFQCQEFNQLMAEAGSELDPEVRHQLYIKAQRIIHREAPWIFGYVVDIAAAFGPRVAEWELHPIYLNFHLARLAGQR